MSSKSHSFNLDKESYDKTIILKLEITAIIYSWFGESSNAIISFEVFFSQIFWINLDFDSFIGIEKISPVFNIKIIDSISALKNIYIKGFSFCSIFSIKDNIKSE